MSRKTFVPSSNPSRSDGNASDLDPAVLEELRDLFGRDGVAQMIEALQRDLPRQRQQLADALAAQDRGALKEIAHGLRGVALQLGAARMVQDWLDIEASLAATAPLTGIGADSDRMLDRHAAMVQALQAALRDG